MSNLVKLNFNLHTIKANEISKPISMRSDIVRLQPQLAYDPKIGEDAELFWSYRKANSLNMDFTNNYFVEPKMDGVRGQFVCEYANNDIRIYCLSRANRKLTSVEHLISKLNNPKLVDFLASHEYQNYNRLVIDCELFCYAKDNPDYIESNKDAANQGSRYAEFRYINGLTNRKQPDSETANLRAYIFQIYYIDANGNATATEDPRNWEHFISDKLGLDISYFQLPPRYMISSASQLAELITKLKSQHLEGMVVKSTDYRHMNGRTKHWLKLKFSLTGTFRLVDVELGEGKCAGVAGAIKIRDAIGQTTLVGTGMTDSDRAELASLDLTIPTYVDIRYMSKTGSSLREARYLGLRYDLNGLTNVELDIFAQR